MFFLMNDADSIGVYKRQYITLISPRTVATPLNAGITCLSTADAACGSGGALTSL